MSCRLGLETLIDLQFTVNGMSEKPNKPRQPRFQPGSLVWSKGMAIKLFLLKSREVSKDFEKFIILTG